MPELAIAIRLLVFTDARGVGVRMAYVDLVVLLTPFACLQQM